MATVQSNRYSLLWCVARRETLQVSTGQISLVYCQEVRHPQFPRRVGHLRLTATDRDYYPFFRGLCPANWTGLRVAEGRRHYLTSSSRISLNERTGVRRKYISVTPFQRTIDSPHRTRISLLAATRRCLVCISAIFFHRVICTAPSQHNHGKHRMHQEESKNDHLYQL